MKRLLFYVLGVIALLGLVESLHAQGTAFTYQGKLADTNGIGLSGSYDLQFKLHPGPTGSSQVGSTIVVPGVAVTNGLFTVSIDFGAGIFTGVPLWLEIGVRTNGVGSFAILSPTQQFTATPYAITAQQ